VWARGEGGWLATDKLSEVGEAVGAHWANGAGDAVACPYVTGATGRTRTGCRHPGPRFDLTRTGERAAAGRAVVRLAVPVRDFWDDIGFT